MDSLETFMFGAMIAITPAFVGVVCILIHVEIEEWKDRRHKARKRARKKEKKRLKALAAG